MGWLKSTLGQDNKDWVLEPLRSSVALKRFENSLKALERAGKEVKTYFTFHGTARAIERSIKTNGLIAGGEKGVGILNGTACGKGVYSSTYIGTATSYARQTGNRLRSSGIVFGNIIMN